MAKSLLVKEEQGLILVEMYYQVKKTKQGYVSHRILTEEEGKKLIERGDPSVDVLHTKWVTPTWKISNKIMRSSTYYNPADGTQRLDPTKYRDNIFKTCLKEWDIQDDNGNIVPINDETIGMLPNPVAEELLKRYDKSTVSDETDEKK
jgi:hypothetical protein